MNSKSKTNKIHTNAFRVHMFGLTTEVKIRKSNGVITIVTIISNQGCTYLSKIAS